MIDIGNRIRDIRKERKVTLIELSKSTGVAQATLSRIETGDMIGTVECHQKVANALGMNLSELYDGIDGRKTRTKLTQSGKGEIISHNGDRVRAEILTSRALKKKLFPVKLLLKGSSKTETEKADRMVEKFIYCIEGDAVVHLDKTAYPLKSEESLYFDGSLPHHIENKSSKTAKLLTITSPPA